MIGIIRTIALCALATTSAGCAAPYYWQAIGGQLELLRKREPIDEIVASHRLLTGPRTDADDVARMHDVVRESHTERQTTLLVHANGHVYDSSWELHEVDLEEIALAYLGRRGPTAAGTREAVRA